jgi:hypothetical protein
MKKWLMYRDRWVYMLIAPIAYLVVDTFIAVITNMQLFWWMKVFSIIVIELLFTCITSWLQYRDGK